MASPGSASGVAASDPRCAPGGRLERAGPVDGLAPDLRVADLHEIDAQVDRPVRVPDPPLGPPEVAAAGDHHNRVARRHDPAVLGAHDAGDLARAGPTGVVADDLREGLARVDLLARLRPEHLPLR